MQNRKFLSLISSFIIIGLASAACKVSLPENTPQVDAIATSAAGTLEALEKTAAVIPTTEDHSLPTLESTLNPTNLPGESVALAVAFVGPDRNAYAWNESIEDPVQLTFSGDVEGAYISPDGSLVAITRSSDWNHYFLDVVQVDGTEMHTLLSPNDFSSLPRPEGSISTVPYQVEWSPGTNMLAINTRITFDGPGLQIGPELYLINTVDGTKRTLLSTEGTWRFSYSPDGSIIAICRPESLDLYKSDGSLMAQDVLRYAYVNTASEYEWVSSPTWSGDGTSLMLVVPPFEPWTELPGDSIVWRVSINELKSKQTMSDQMVFFPSGFASISPDLTRVLYFVSYGPATDNFFSIKLANTDGTFITDYDPGRFAFPPEWSRDSSRFFFFDNWENLAYIGNADGSSTALTGYGKVDSVKWVDADRFLVASGPEDGWRLLLGSEDSPPKVIYSTSLNELPLVFTVNR